jgi:uncharacterized membrane protein
MGKKTLNKTVWYKPAIYPIALGIAGLVIAYLLVSRAIDTGSWWEYLGALVFLILAINRFSSVKLRRQRD